MTGWRLGYGIFPKKIFKFAEKLAINCHSCISIPTQIAGIEALNGNQDSVNKMVDVFQERRDFLVEQINTIKNVKCLSPGGAFYIFPKIKKKNMSSKEVSNYLLEKKFVATVPGSSFGKNGEGFLRVSYASNKESLIKFINLLKEFMNE